ncbi:MAG: hypothetical protein AAF587_11505 [Bacteroidota bacterium]
MMRYSKPYKAFLLSFWGVWCLSLGHAHPSFALIITDQGDLLFADVLHNEGTIWKYSSEGKLTALLTGEHCHMIFADSRGVIWGTDHAYIEAIEGNENTLWRLDQTGKKEIIIAPTREPTEFSGVNFVLNRKNRLIFPHNGQLYQRDLQGASSLLSSHQFGRIMSIQIDHQDRLYIADNNTDNGSVYQLLPSGHLHQLTNKLLEKPPPNPPFEMEMHNMFLGMSVDDSGNVLLANIGSRRISQITQDGTTAHIYHAEAPWFPVAALRKDGKLYVEEVGYQAGKGHLGPRIVLWDGKQKQIIVEIPTP